MLELDAYPVNPTNIVTTLKLYYDANKTNVISDSSG